MKVSILSVCPEYFNSLSSNQVIARAIKSGLLDLAVYDIRSFTKGSFRAIDDSPYGGGTGMILRVDTLYEALKAVKTDKSHVVLLEPKGAVLNQQKAIALSAYEELILVCGHFEGIDARFEKYADEIISIGDFILSGGEPAAMVIVDSITRLLPNVMKDGVVDSESFSLKFNNSNLLEYLQYTHPFEYDGQTVPSVLLSGNHAKIEEFRLQSALEETKKWRPDLLKNQ